MPRQRSFGFSNDLALEQWLYLTKIPSFAVAPKAAIEWTTDLKLFPYTNRTVVPYDARPGVLARLSLNSRGGS